MCIDMKNHAVVVKQRKPLDRPLRDYKKLEEKSILGLFRNILLCRSTENVNAAVTIAKSINMDGINSDRYPLSLKILESNNRYAIDALLEGYSPEKYLDFVAPNYFLVESIFKIFSRYKRNEIYSKTLRVFFGFLIKVYSSPEEAYQLFQPKRAHVNDIGKILDESKDQGDDINRDILDILMFFADLDTRYATDHHKKVIARQAGRVRSDFFDNKRRLSQSLTEVLLGKSAKLNMGVTPAYVYIDG